MKYVVAVANSERRVRPVIRNDACKPREHRIVVPVVERIHPVAREARDRDGVTGHLAPAGASASHATVPYVPARTLASVRSAPVPRRVKIWTTPVTAS